MTDNPPRKAIAALLAQPGVAQVLDLLDCDGEEARIAGGAVRDLLLSRPVREVDFATSAVPDEVMRRAATAGIRSVPTGVTHGTVTLVVAGEPYEVTTLRRDVATDGRRAEVAFGRDWAADAARRDFTINGLFLDRSGHIHDHVGGLEDISRGRLAFIGDPDSRIREDYLRILRFFRFFALLPGVEGDMAALAAAAHNRAGLAQLSRERVGQEFIKLLSGLRAPEAVALMAGHDLLMPVIRGVPSIARFARLSRLKGELGQNPDPVLALAALAVMKCEDAERLGRVLRLSKHDTARLERLAAKGKIPPRDSRALRELLYRLGPDAYRDRVLFAWAESGEGDADFQARLALPDHWTAPVFPLSGRDLAARGLAPGPRLGQALRWAEAEWIHRDFPLDRASLDAILIAAAARF